MSPESLLLQIQPVCSNQKKKDPSVKSLCPRGNTAQVIKVHHDALDDELDVRGWNVLKQIPVIRPRFHSAGHLLERPELLLCPVAGAHMFMTMTGKWTGGLVGVVPFARSPWLAAPLQTNERRTLTPLVP